MKEKLKSFFYELFSLSRKTENVKMKYIALQFFFVVCFLYFSLCQLPSANSHKHITVCVFHNLTGYPCPACGTIRGMKYFFHLDFFNALYINPLAVIVSVFMVVSFVWISLDLIRGKQSFYNKVFFVKISKVVILIVVVLTILNWYWNICKGL